MNLLYDVDLEVSWEESPGFFKGFDWDFLPSDPNTLLFAQNAISGSGVVFDLIYNNLNPGTVGIVINNPEFTGVAAIIHSFNPA